MRASQVAELVDGTLVGDGDMTVTGIAPLLCATSEQLSFLVHPRNVPQLQDSLARCIITSEQLWRSAQDGRGARTAILCHNPVWAMAVVYGALCPTQAPAPGVHATAHVDAAAHVHPSAHIGPGCVVQAGATIAQDAQLLPQSFVGQGAHVGARTVLHPGARVLWGCTIGDGCILHAGCVVGADGFGFATNAATSEHLKVPQLGTVILGHNVELGANSTIDRGTFGATTIGDGCKIDNLVQIGHNVVLGKHCVVVSQTGIAGSAILGDSVTVGAQGGIVGHLHIASGTTLAARTGVISSLPNPGVYAGAPAMEHRAWLRMMAAMRDLGAMRKRLAALTRAEPPATKAT